MGLVGGLEGVVTAEVDGELFDWGEFSGDVVVGLELGLNVLTGVLEVDPRATVDLRLADEAFDGESSGEPDVDEIGSDLSWL